MNEHEFKALKNCFGTNQRLLMHFEAELLLANDCLQFEETGDSCVSSDVEKLIRQLENSEQTIVLEEAQLSSCALNFLDRLPKSAEAADALKLIPATIESKKETVCEAIKRMSEWNEQGMTWLILKD